MKKASLTDNISDWIIKATGTTIAVLLHLAWFILWFMFKLDVSLLTNLVSLEAIFLSIFVLIQSNNHTKHLKDLHKKLDKKMSL